MRLSAYLRSRAGYYALGLVSLAFASLFLYVFHTPWRAIVIAIVLIIIGFGLAEALEYRRRALFYNRLYECLEGMDKPYLVGEMLEEPEFLEGAILCDVLHETSLSMSDHVNTYRRESEDFREFIELWVHEIKLPVAGLQLMAHNDGNERYARQLARIDDMVQNVLFYARSESAEKDYVIRETSLARTFANVALKSRDELLERGVQIETEGLDQTVMTDGKWLEYMLGQLMANSVKYASPDRDLVIRVSAEDLDDRVVLHFRDNGIGIAPEDLPHIFEKSFTGSNGRIGQNSTGFGLYIIDKLCSRLGHQVQATSEQGEWTEVTISFGKNLLFELEA